MSNVPAFDEGWDAAEATYTHNIAHADRAGYRRNPYPPLSASAECWADGWAARMARGFKPSSQPPPGRVAARRDVDAGELRAFVRRMAHHSAADIAEMVRQRFGVSAERAAALTRAATGG